MAFDQIDFDAAQAELNGLLATREYLCTNIQASRQKLMDTPRGDKQGAHEIKQQILRDESEIKDLRPQIAKLRERVEGRERHSHFMAAIVDLWGADAVHRIHERIREMKQERRASFDAAAAQPAQAGADRAGG